MTTFSAVPITNTNEIPAFKGYTWTFAAAAANDVGEAIEIPNIADKTVSVVGTWGSGGTILIQGSLNGTDWFTLKDPWANDLSFSTPGNLNGVALTPRYIRPKLSAGTGTINLVVTLNAVGR